MTPNAYQRALAGTDKRPIKEETMSPKPPVRGNASVDVHQRPGPSPQANPPRINTGAPPLRLGENPLVSNRNTGGVDLDAIRPAPPVTVHETTETMTLGATPTPTVQSLEHYRISAPPTLAVADAEGFRTYKGRRYVDEPGGAIVPVKRDPDTGLYRAALPKETKPTGPVMLRDTASGLWHPLEDFEPMTFALSSTRLEALRTGLDLSDATPDSNGLHQFDGKLYVVIENHTYQVLHDPEASTPLATVMRIVRSEDPVSRDNGNLYVATRPGRSEPIVFDAVQGWVGITVAGAGGMVRSDGNPTASLSLPDRLSLMLNRLRSPESRAQKLFPDHTEDQISDFIRSLGSDVRDGLTRRETDYKTLKAELKVWIRNTSNASPQATAKGWAQQVANDIKRCWRQQTGDSFRLEPGGGTLPALTADFSHIRRLDLDAVTWSDTAETFLSGFSGLERLTVTHSSLDTLPAAVAHMPHLSTLDLSSNRIVLNAQTSAKLSALDQLQNLDLSGNPLGKPPDFTGMSELKTLNLSNTQLDQWPIGLQHQSGLKQVDLRNNRLTEVPSAILSPSPDQFEAIARINGVTQFEGNPFPAGYWKTLEVYWQRVTADHPELGNNSLPGAFRLDGDIPEVANVQRLHPEKNAQEAREFFIGLGPEAEATLGRRLQELDLLESQLDAYVADSQLEPSAVDTPAKRQAQRVAQTLKDCWLQDSGEMLRLSSINAPLPALSVDFSHVKHLSLSSVIWSGDADTFLSSFPNLERLSITQSRIETLPGQIGAMDKLNNLDLSNNYLALDEQSAATLSAMSHLEIINLSDNPTLTLTPDFSKMSKLKYLVLNNTGINQWPTGLQDKTGLLIFDLRDNRLSEVPQAFLNPAPEQLLTIAQINRTASLGGNNFPADYWRKFDDYWRRVNEEHPDLLTSYHGVIFDTDNSPAQRYRRLFPGKDIKECREYLWSFESDTAAATKLNSLEREHGVLKSQLDDWVFSGGGNRAGYIRANQLAVNAQTRPDRVTASERILSCWRRETPQKHANDGTPIGLELDLGGLRLPSLPDIDADFSHVGSLKLNNMNLSTSPEGFLTHFRHVRWLNLSHNQLRELPPALGEMNGLTRLFLQKNRIILTADTARVLSQRTTLRALWLHENPQLGITPDFTRITDMRELDLANTGINTFPAGLADQPLLGIVNLNNNRIEEIPDAVITPPAERLANSARVNNVTSITNNPLSAATRTRLEQYNNRLIEAEIPMTSQRDLVATARGHVRAVIRAPANDPMTRWTIGLSADQVSARRIQWQTLRDEQRSDGLFNTLERLIEVPAGHNELQRRVWKLIDSITENSPASERLRKEVFDRAGEAACCDRAAFTFANLETRAMAHDARAQAQDEAQGPQLSALSKALFRLHEVDKIASADIAQREARIIEAMEPQRDAALPAPHVPEEVEIRLAYRYFLKDRLQLPGQPEQMGFARLANVSKAQLNAAYKKVIAMDNSPEEFEALVSREFWQEFVTHKYRSQFEAHRQTFQDRQATLDDAHAANTLGFNDYDAQSKALQKSLATEEEALIESLSRQELSEHPAANTDEEAGGTTE